MRFDGDEIQVVNCPFSKAGAKVSASASFPTPDFDFFQKYFS
jgi:hypothetical protein